MDAKVVRPNGRKYCCKKDKKTNHPQHRFAASRTVLPSKVDLRPNMPPVYDQGQLGSCSANALGAAFQYDILNGKTIKLPLHKTHAFHDCPSRLFVYYNERAMEGDINEDNGAALEDGVQSLKEKGACPESMWPYDITKFAQCPPSAAYGAAYHTKVTNYKKLSQDLTQLKTSLSQGYPVCFGMQIFASFEGDAVASNGVVPMPQPNEQNLGGHAVLISGYDDSKQVFIVRNSWGNQWGDGGYFYLPYQYVLDPKLCSDFWVLVGVEA
jgi:C1A family cysteine protease